MIEWIASCGPLPVPVPLMAAVVQAESSGHPLAIGVVGGQLERQPRTLAEALATVAMLEREGMNYSLGAAQINKSNFARYGIQNPTQAFDWCTSVRTGADILAECHSRAQDWGRALSCYYSGNFTTGFRHGYVQRVQDLWRRQAGVSTPREARPAEPLPRPFAFDPVQPEALAQAAPEPDLAPAPPPDLPPAPAPPPPPPPPPRSPDPAFVF